MQKLVLASNNAGKVKEFQGLLAPLNFQVIPQGELGIPSAEEPHCTFVENALAKARHASAASGLPALADDSGICAHALNGKPGVLSARFAGEQGNDAAIGKVIGPSFYADEIPDVMSNIINTYVAQRNEGEAFIDTYNRLGVAPFKEAAYKNAKKKEKVEATGSAS